MSNKGTKTGLIGFFDILGYQNLLERNEPETIAKEVMPILTSIGERIPKALKDIDRNLAIELEKGVESEKLRKHEKIIEAIGWLVFSDTVLLTLAINEVDPDMVYGYWMTFLLAAIVLQDELFKAGLPTRGAIEYGKFFVKDTCFAGRTIVNAYQLCNQIELAACVLSETAANEFRRVERIVDTGALYGTFIIEYLIPMKSGEKHLLTVMAHTYNIKAPDIHNEVMRAFWGNKKDISITARKKAENTEQWLEFLEHQQKRK
jgi:hypothetical protein